jgi:aminomethyltransferase
MGEPNRTVLHGRHVALGGKMVEFAGWEMPLHYQAGIVAEHLKTRRFAGLFDVSHMGRFVFRGAGALAFLQHVLTNNAAALDVGQAQYTMIPNERGGAVDDAYLYRFFGNEYLLVVNAANRQKDWDHLQSARAAFPQVEMTDESWDLAMLSLQGPLSKEILGGVLESGSLPEPRRNALSIVAILGRRVSLGRTGYTGEPLCFEAFLPQEAAGAVWDLLMARGASPVGLGARDTLRLEACLPLYGHELGIDPEGGEIPIFACALAKRAVSFSPLKGEFIGRAALRRQHEEFRRILQRDPSAPRVLPRMIMPFAMLSKSIARAGAKVLSADGKEAVGYVTSGTMVPYWKMQGEKLTAQFTDETGMRAIGLAIVDSRLHAGQTVQVEVRGRPAEAVIVPFHLRSDAPPYTRPILHESLETAGPPAPPVPTPAKVHRLFDMAVENTTWRQRECLNLIPSEMTVSPPVRLLSIMDAAFRYAEHKEVRAFYDAEIFYYQGTDFIEAVEQMLEDELRHYLGCPEVETRVISGQMANTVVFSALVDYANQADPGVEPRRIRQVLNHPILRGGHLSAQPMGALRDFVARDPRTERPAVVPFPAMAENPYRTDVAACAEVLARYKPQLVIFGKSMVLHPEPVREISAMVKQLGLDAVLMYDMAHVLGLVGPRFQEPFKEGADVVTGSTHKTFFGTQRGLVAMSTRPDDARWPLWEAVRRRTFPGSVSNHHLGTLLGLLMAAYEMNHFRDEYQKQVLANARALAGALKHCGMNVAGDPALGYTQTHQVVVEVGYAKGPEVARRLEESNIIVNYQACPHEEGFTAAGALRLGVAEMTRFGMQEADFGPVAEMMADAALRNRSVKDRVKTFRRKFLDMKFCFTGKEIDARIEQLHRLI